MAIKSSVWKCEAITVVNWTSEQDNRLISKGAQPVGSSFRWQVFSEPRPIPYNKTQVIKIQKIKRNQLDE